MTTSAGFFQIEFLQSLLFYFVVLHVNFEVVVPIGDVVRVNRAAAEMLTRTRITVSI